MLKTNRKGVSCLSWLSLPAALFACCVGAGCFAPGAENDDVDIEDGQDVNAEDETLGTAEQALSDGTYSVSTPAASSQIVSEWLSNKIPSYPANIGQNQWWFCGHAAVATAINHLRQKSPTEAEQITQLQWFHDKLIQYQGSSYTGDPHRQASIDALKSIMANEKGNEFTTSKEATWDREIAKNAMAAALSSGHYVVALGQTNNGIGHFLTVNKIVMKANDPSGQGGTVYFSDVLYDAPGQLGFKTFLDRMKAAGTPGQYSFLKIKKK